MAEGDLVDIEQLVLDIWLVIWGDLHVRVVHFFSGDDGIQFLIFVEFHLVPAEAIVDRVLGICELFCYVRTDLGIF